MTSKAAMSDLTLAVTEAPFALFVPVPSHWPEPTVTLLPRTPLPGVHGAAWPDPKHSTL